MRFTTRLLFLGVLSLGILVLTESKLDAQHGNSLFTGYGVHEIEGEGYSTKSAPEAEVRAIADALEKFFEMGDAITSCPEISVGIDVLTMEISTSFSTGGMTLGIPAQDGFREIPPVHIPPSWSSTCTIHYIVYSVD